jgi:hypothetical protein
VSPELSKGEFLGGEKNQIARSPLSAPGNCTGTSRARRRMRAATPAKPVPSNSTVAGSGTGAAEDSPN